MNFILVLFYFLIGFIISGDLLTDILGIISFAFPFTKELDSLKLIKNKKKLYLKLYYRTLLDILALACISIFITIFSPIESIFYYFSLLLALINYINNAKVKKRTTLIYNYMSLYLNYTNIKSIKKDLDYIIRQEYLKGLRIDKNDDKEMTLFSYFVFVLLNGFLKVHDEINASTKNFNLVREHFETLKSLAKKYVLTLSTAKRTYTIQKLAYSISMYLDIIDKNIKLSYIFEEFNEEKNNVNYVIPSISQIEKLKKEIEKLNRYIINPKSKIYCYYCNSKVSIKNNKCHSCGKDLSIKNYASSLNNGVIENDKMIEIIRENLIDSLKLKEIEKNEKEELTKKIKEANDINILYALSKNVMDVLNNLN